MTDVAATSELEQAGAQELLQSATVARLAYNGHDGFPRVVPVGFLWSAPAVVVCTATTAPKVKALASRPQVALTIDTASPARSLLLRGTAKIEIVGGVAPEYLAAAAKSMAGDDLAAFEEQVRTTYPEMARIAVVPSWARYFDFGSGRLPTFLQELVGSGGA